MKLKKILKNKVSTHRKKYRFKICGIFLPIRREQCISFFISLCLFFFLVSCSDFDTSKSLSTTDESETTLESDTSESREENLLDLFISDEPIKKETKLGETAVFDGVDTIFDKFKAKIRLESIKYGDEANDIVMNAHRNNSECLNGFEYVIAEFSVKIEHIYSDSNVCNINPGNFTILDSNYKAYPEVFGIKNVESKARDLRVGSNVIYKLLFQKNKVDSVVRISFLNRNPAAPLFVFDIPNRFESTSKSDENQALIDFLSPQSESEENQASSESGSTLQ